MSWGLISLNNQLPDSWYFGGNWVLWVRITSVSAAESLHCQSGDFVYKSKLNT